AYRPQTAAGIYVPTALPAVSQWPGRKPWLMANAAQFRPGPPPTLASETWVRDYDEIKAMGAKNSTRRSTEQTAVARFWEATLPPIYYGVVRSVADMPGRDVTRNARLYATVAQAMDDALIAVFDAKYHYGFWRPITAIRNGDNDGNGTTERDASWVPFIDTPMHPEYPCAHCIVASAVGTVLKAELGDTPAPTLTTTSHTAGDAARSWSSIDAFVDEVSNARIWDGVHFRTSTEVGKAMGRQVGGLAAQRYLRAKP
ncbi:MAG TPA: vanadium-dependent haloperoxidase, partial [Pseudoxanthomonas sp.]|nr:vanadium-dependent haloperoxidase [Pseudoxanthomonas sp.]